MGINLYHLVEIIETSEDIIETPAEDLALWQRMNIFDARAMLGLYCYRAGYFPAALAQWTRIPERNRALRPEIDRLLEELNNRLALERQETQPMRREQILRELPPLISGNLPPADLPNPHEPIRNEEAIDERVGDWPRLQTSTYPLNTDTQERQITIPLRDTKAARANGHANNTLSEQRKEASLDDTLPSIQPTARQKWLVRLLRFPNLE
jgi:hypothetical protein